MRNLIGLKNMLIFSAVLLTIGSVSAQQAFAGGPTCTTDGDGNWNNAGNWNNCDSGIPGSDNDVIILSGDKIVITDDHIIIRLQVIEGSTLFIDCDASLNLFSSIGTVSQGSNVTNHGTLTSVDFLTISGPGSNLFNSGTFSGVTTLDGGSIVEISTICSQPIGGTVGSIGTVSLLVAGAQANMGWGIIALVGAVVGVGIVYKAKTNKTDKETL